MKLKNCFFRIPLCFDAEKLTAEIQDFTEADWRPHPEGLLGNSALALIAVNGDPSNDSAKGPYFPTPHLKRCPYLQQVLASIPGVWGRTRLMRIDGGAEVKRHFDTNYYWIQRVRVHIPIVTFPEVTFVCGDKSVNMSPGEIWIFDTWKLHSVTNPTPHSRIHLVADTVGSSDFWALVEQSEAPPKFIAYSSPKKVDIITEHENFPIVMSPWEQSELISFILKEILSNQLNSTNQVNNFSQILNRFQQEWRALWAMYGATQIGEDKYLKALNNLESCIHSFQTKLTLPNHADAVDIVKRLLITPALNYDLLESHGFSRQFSPQPSPPSLTFITKNEPPFQRPVFIVSAPRSGSTLLFETLAKSPTAWTVGGESHHVIEAIEQLNPASKGFESNGLTAIDATEEVIQKIKDGFLNELRDYQGHRLESGTSTFRLLEKTPKNSLRIKFINAIFPDALFIYLYREPKSNISSILEAWKSRKFITYPQLPNWSGPPWSLLLIPGWETLNNKSLVEISAYQWIAANTAIIESLSELSNDRWCAVDYADLIRSPKKIIQQLCDFASLKMVQDLEKDLPLSRHTLTKPEPQKWKKNQALINKILPQVKPIHEQLKVFKSQSGEVGIYHPLRFSQNINSPIKNSPKQASENLKSVNKVPDSIETQNQSPLRSVYTTTFADLLNQIKSSLIISTYQAGKLIIVRSDQESLETHFEFFAKPMGIAVNKNRLAIGGKNQVVEFQNIEAVARRLELLNKYDACYLPRHTHITGNIDIHEMAWANDELWIVNTRFSCLCTLESSYSFVPRWRPSFITELAPEDRCHLNGLEIVNGRPKYVTALGYSNVAGGWRSNKTQGGILIDIDSNKIIAQGLSMPHSPRWYQNKLWFLESGKGSLATIDLQTGQVNTIIQLPGFTRGLDFYGPFAFIGLSQVRETAIFNDLPLTAQFPERNSGVWVVNINTGKMVAFLKFQDAVQEIFAVCLLAGLHFPELVSDNDALLDNSYVLPDDALNIVPPALL